MEFGPEIKVDGKRPEWLKDGDVWQWRIAGYPHFEDGIAPSEYEKARTFGLIQAIRLPTNDARYDPTPTPDERAVALIRKIAKGDWSPGYETEAEARAIVAALEPVDPMLLEARKIVADQYGEGGNVAHLRDQALSGEGDEWFHTKVALAALRRGRALASQTPSRDVTPCTREQFEEDCRS